jgi:DNA polymerase-3 subunit gamma/tau
MLDVIEIDGASNNGVENVRDLIEKARFEPNQGKYKVYIIDEVHMLSTGAFNALLKTLEEPPAHVKFILATTEIEKVPETIRSRSLRFDFRKITEKDIIKRLQFVANAECINAEDEALEIIAKAARG